MDISIIHRHFIDGHFIDGHFIDGHFIDVQFIDTSIQKHRKSDFLDCNTNCVYSEKKDIFYLIHEKWFFSLKRQINKTSYIKHSIAKKCHIFKMSLNFYYRAANSSKLELELVSLSSALLETTMD